jgi:quercetin dioxygenase-like cupin family protein
MTERRVFTASDHFREARPEPPRTVITETPHAAVVAWSVEPGQRIERHVHPLGQDTWIVLQGEGLYFTDRADAGVPLAPGSVAVAPAGAVHGALNTGKGLLRFVSVVSPALSGFEPLGG